VIDQATRYSRHRTEPRRTTILLVEDEASLRKITALLLKSLGYRLQEASSGEEALHLTQGGGEKIDLVMTDVLMPGMSGRELADMLRARDASLKVLFQSGHTGDTLVRYGIEQTEAAFLQKPFTLDALAKKLREVLDRR
jgi:two-component system, cell cycle sensor histidine kinase and response regulator CckA